MKQLPFILGFATTLALAAPAFGQDALAEKVKAIQKEYQAAATEYSTAIRAVKLNEDRAAVAKEKMPDRAKFAARYLEAVSGAPADPAAAEALIQAVTLDFRGSTGAKAIALLAAHHVSNPRITNVMTYLPYTGEAGEKLARALSEKGADRDVRGKASMALAKILKDTNPAEAENTLKLIIEKYADVSAGRGTLGEQAQKDIDHAKKFGTGKPAPEIAGQDIDGKDFKLSDYRGKVVMIDFWGDW